MRNYPLSNWWVAATAVEVGRQPLGRWLLDKPVVLYRTEAGRVVALDDRCMHRSAPLSSGYLDGDVLVCGYHGARFDDAGRCVRFPTQATVPASACVRAYPVLERGPLVWIWLGEPAAAERAPPPPALDWAMRPEWTVVQGKVPLHANYMLFHENVLDLTHFNTLHRNSFGITRWEPAAYSIEGDRVRSWQQFDGTRLNVQELMQLRMDMDTISMSVESWFESPAMHWAETIKLRRPGADMPEREQSFIAHFVTPESAAKTHYWWMFGMDTLLEPETAAGLQGLIASGFDEDKVMLNAIQALLERDPRGLAYPELSFVGDSGALMARRVVQRLLEREGVGIKPAHPVLPVHPAPAA